MLMRYGRCTDAENVKLPLVCGKAEPSADLAQELFGHIQATNNK